MSLILFDLICNVNSQAEIVCIYVLFEIISELCVIVFTLELGGIPVHTEYRCLFFLWYEFLKYRNTGVI